MHLLVLAVLVTLTSADLAPLFKHEKKIDGEYIVLLKDDGDFEGFRNRMGNVVGMHIKREFRKVFKGFAATMNLLALREVRSQADVAFVEEDAVVEKYDVAESWGLDRVDQRNLPLDSQANFPGDGTGVTAYILDTGIYPGHQYFEGRASVAFDSFGEDGLDCVGHGTHCAGTVGSNPYGVARNVALKGVRVLDCFSSGSYSGVVAGVEWVAANRVGPSVASMSLGGGSSNAVNRAIQGLYNSGVAVSVAAGNSNDDACYYSPAGEPLAITVGATQLKTGASDQRSVFSNYGTCVDIFAPGTDIPSTYIGSPTTVREYSGTSMACPHVTGALCVLLGNDNTLTPAALEQQLMAMTTNNIIGNVGNGSPNKLLYIGTDAVKPRRLLRFESPKGIKKMKQVV